MTRILTKKQFLPCKCFASIYIIHTQEYDIDILLGKM